MTVCSVSTLLANDGKTLWRADALARSGDSAVLATGYAALDVVLPGGGWPVGALCEILQDQNGFAEWRLLLPALCSLENTLVLVGSPHAPFGPGLSARGLDVHQLLWVQTISLPERLWVAEQALRCAGVAALLVWLPAVPTVQSDHLRRLHLAAQSHRKLLFVMRDAGAQHASSPAVLRLLLESGMGHSCDAIPLHAHILKRRGPPLGHPVELTAATC
jgi:protein ImuA